MNCPRCIFDLAAFCRRCLTIEKKTHNIPCQFQHCIRLKHFLSIAVVKRQQTKLTEGLKKDHFFQLEL